MRSYDRYLLSTQSMISLLRHSTFSIVTFIVESEIDFCRLFFFIIIESEYSPYRIMSGLLSSLISRLRYKHCECVVIILFDHTVVVIILSLLLLNQSLHRIESLPSNRVSSRLGLDYYRR